MILLREIILLRIEKFIQCLYITYGDDHKLHKFNATSVKVVTWFFPIWVGELDKLFLVHKAKQIKRKTRKFLGKMIGYNHSR